MFRSRVFTFILLSVLIGTTSAIGQCTPSTSPAAQICSPANGATVTSPVHWVVGTADSHRISAIYTYVDNIVVNKTYAGQVDTFLTIAAGTHVARVQAWDSTGAILRASVTITVTSGPPTTTVTVSPGSATVAPGGTQQFAPTVTNNSDTSVTWSVDGVAGGNSTVGTVSSSGLYTAPAATGSHTVTATSAADTSKSGSATVNVTTTTSCTPPTSPAAQICSPANGATVTSPVHWVVGTADSHRISAIYTYVDNIVVNKTYAGQVDTFLTIAAGAHTARVQAWDSTGAILRASVTITVTSGPPTTTVTVSPGSATMGEGVTQQFTATVSNNSNTSVTWSVDGVAGGNTTTGTISASGLYTAPSAAGSHTVTATSVADTTKSGSATVSVTAPPSIVTVSPRQAVTTPDHTLQFTANTSVTWSVDSVAGGNPTVGTISSSGLYTPPPTAGSHSITATETADATKSGTATAYVTDYAGTFNYHNDNARTGQNTSETVLTPSNVNTGQFGKLFSRAVDGFVFAQPLYVKSVNIGGAAHNVVFVATEHASVYAFDADGRSSSPLWHRSFINPSAGINVVTSSEVGNSDLGPEAGITSTPVIDNTVGVMYVLVRTNESGAYFQRLHAINLSSGNDTMTAAVVSATVNGSGVGGDGSGHISFNPLVQNQRAALLLANGNVYVAWASHGDLGAYHGWVMAFNASTLARVGVLNLSPNGKEGSVWGGGAGPAADSSGNIYFATGNGTNDVATSNIDLGDSYVKTNATLAPTDIFSPFDQATLNSGDLDLGASGVFLPPDQGGSHPHILIGSGKRGDLYVVDRDNMGGFHSGSNSNIVQYLPRAVGLNSSPDELFGIGSYWNGNVYFAGSFDHLRQFTLSNGLLSMTAAHTSPTVLSSNRAAEPVISSDGSSNGIVWVIATDTYQSSSPAVLHAYDANDVSNELYNTAQAGSRDLGGKVVKFTSPTVANGRVYMGTRSELDVFGLLP